MPASEASAEMEIVGVHLWNGRKDPHLYTMKAVLAESGAELIPEKCASDAGPMRSTRREALS